MGDVVGLERETLGAESATLAWRVSSQYRFSVRAEENAPM